MPNSAKLELSPGKSDIVGHSQSDDEVATSTSETQSTIVSRAVVPSMTVLAASEATVRSVFADEYSSAKTSTEQSTLAAKLLQIGLDTTDEIAGRYVTIRSARNVAVKAGNVDLAFRAVEALADSFEIDILAEQARLAGELSKASLVDDETTKLNRRIDELRQQAFDRDVYPIAVSLNELARGQEKEKETDRDWREQTDRWTARLTAGAAAFDLVEDAQRTLETAPDDASANLAIGRYYCLLKGEWQSGLPYLAKGSHEGLRAIAAREIGSSGTSFQETLSLADTWRELSAELGEIEKLQTQIRAYQLYQWALPNLSGLTKARVEKRLRELRAVGVQPEAKPPWFFKHGPGTIDSSSIPDLKTITNSIGMKLVLIPAGEFMMGGSRSAEETARKFNSDATTFANEHPRHRVVISEDYYIGETEVSQGHWFEVMDSKPWIGKEQMPEGEGYPATYVSYHDAIDFCMRLSDREGRSYVLPTEAQWEYACRAGTTTSFSFGDDVVNLDKFAWFGGQVDAEGDLQFAKEVRQKLPNGFGLYDMHGNVWEWCSDWYGGDYYRHSETVNPIGPAAGKLKVFRGGGWQVAPERCRSSVRGRLAPPSAANFLGFRVAVSNAPKASRGAAVE